MRRDGQFDEETGAVAVTNCAKIGVHEMSETGGDEKTEARAAGAHGNRGGANRAVGLETAPNCGRKGGAIIADGDADFAAAVGNGKFARDVMRGIMQGIDTEIIYYTVQ